MDVSAVHVGGSEKLRLVWCKAVVQAWKRNLTGRLISKFTIRRSAWTHRCFYKLTTWLNELMLWTNYTAESQTAEKQAVLLADIIILCFFPPSSCLFIFNLTFSDLIWNWDMLQSVHTVDRVMCCNSGDVPGEKGWWRWMAFLLSPCLRSVFRLTLFLSDWHNSWVCNWLSESLTWGIEWLAFDCGA